MAKKSKDLESVMRARFAKLGWSGRELSRRSGVDPAQVTRFVNGERTIRLNTASQLCAAMGLGLVVIDDSMNMEG